MKKLIVLAAALTLLSLPAAAGAKVVLTGAGGGAGAAAANAQSAKARSTSALSEKFRMQVVPSRSTSCTTISQGCLDGRGGAMGRPLSGSALGNLTVDWSQSTTTANGTCAPAGGSIQISDSAGNALKLNQTGTLCKRNGNTYVFSGSYNVADGSGRYDANGAGTGSASWTMTGNAVHGALTGGFDPNTAREEGGAITDGG
jgi:hypothetical protein